MTASLGWRYRFMIAVIAVAAYAPTLKTGFMWDDHVMIENNPVLKSWSLTHLKHDFTSDVFDHHGDAYYRPGQTLANRVDFSLWGLHAVGYHLTNLLFHIGNALLSAGLALALGFAPLIAFILGCLFAVHPIVVEQLMIIAGRAELMGLFFMLLSLLLMLKKDRRSLAAGWAAYLAARFCKESTLITPLLLGACFYYRDELSTRYRRIVAMLLVWIPYLAWRHHVVGPITEQSDVWFTVRFFFQAFPSVVARYLSLIVWPWNLHSHRLLPHLSHFWFLYLLLFIGSTFFITKRFGRLGVFCIAWFLLNLLPKTPVMIYGNFMLDHWAYPAAIGVLLPLAVRVARGWESRREKLRLITALGFFSALIGLSLLVHLNVALRGTDEKMYRWALRFTTSNPIKYNLGILLLQTGRPAEAIGYFANVQAYYPDDSNNVNALALAYWQLGQRRAATRLLEAFLKNHPHDRQTEAHLNFIKKVSGK